MKKIFLLFLMFGVFSNYLLAQEYCLKVKKVSETSTDLTVSFELSSSDAASFVVDAALQITGGGSINNIVHTMGVDDVNIGGGLTPVTINKGLGGVAQTLFVFPKNTTAGAATFTVDDATGGLGVFLQNSGRLTKEAGCLMNCIISPAVSIAVTSGSNPSCAGSSVTFTATATDDGGTTPTFQWKKNSVNITSETGSTYTTTGLVNANEITVEMTADLSGAFSCVDATLNGGVKATSNIEMMIINPVPVVTLTSPSSIVYGTNSVDLTATLTVVPATPVPGSGTVQFFIDGNTTAVGSGTVNSSGVATFTYDPSVLSAGNHTIHK
jgi:hypothetical protein